MPTRLACKNEKNHIWNKTYISGSSYFFVTIKIVLFAWVVFLTNEPYSFKKRVGKNSYALFLRSKRYCFNVKRNFRWYVKFYSVEKWNFDTLPWEDTFTMDPDFFASINFFAITCEILTIGLTLTAHNLNLKWTCKLFLMPCLRLQG